jgi:hypothetical protein
LGNTYERDVAVLVIRTGRFDVKHLGVVVTVIVTIRGDWGISYYGGG